MIINRDQGYYPMNGCAYPPTMSTTTSWLLVALLLIGSHPVHATARYSTCRRFTQRSPSSSSCHHPSSPQEPYRRQYPCRALSSAPAPCKPTHLPPPAVYGHLHLLVRSHYQRPHRQQWPLQHQCQCPHQSQRQCPHQSQCQCPHQHQSQRQCQHLHPSPPTSRLPMTRPSKTHPSLQPTPHRSRQCQRRPRGHQVAWSTPSRLPRRPRQSPWRRLHPAQLQRYNKNNSACCL